MKIRSGFVSNSSSSSFMCLVSGDLFGGMDMGLSEFDASQCENRHIFYDDYVVENPNEKGYASWIREEVKTTRMYGDNKGELYHLDFIDLLEATNTQLSDDTGLVSLWEENEGDEYDEVPAFKCPICSLTHIQDSTRVTFLLMVDATVFSSREEIDTAIRKCYTTLQELEKKLKEGKDEN